MPVGVTVKELAGQESKSQRSGEDGIGAIVGNHTPAFFFRDPLRFSSMDGDLSYSARLHRP
jgi:hypothetical protein